MAHHLEGWTAIAFAEKHGGTLKKYRDPTERALKRVSIEKAKRIAREDARLIYMDVPHGKWKSNSSRKNPRKRAATRRKKNPVKIAATMTGKSTGWIASKATRVRTVNGKRVVDIKK